MENQVIQIKAKPWDPALRIAFLAPSVISPCSSLSPPPECPVVFPGEPVPPPATQILQVETFQYITKADGVRSAYTGGDGLAEFQSRQHTEPRNGLILTACCSRSTHTPLRKVSCKSMGSPSREYPSPFNSSESSCNRNYEAAGTVPHLDGGGYVVAAGET
ncbi:Uncharacterised protein [Paenibacillus thiaminolyticus]|nr:Uncharacterised protein [Paenibacillus thiaminolyticus]